MNNSGNAVFLSYASQDAEAAKRICDALRQAGSDGWFDPSELVGGDQWDTKIRGQIKDCALLIIWPRCLSIRVGMCCCIRSGWRMSS